MQVNCTRNHVNSSNHRFCTVCGEPLPLPSGEVIINRYKIVRQLGQGGFGRTYLAEDMQSNKMCVLKEFAPQVEEDKDLQKAKELFEREASVLKQLQHPQIPRFHCSLQVKFSNKDLFFLVQDYVEGENYQDLLEKYLDRGRCFSEAEVLHLLTQILPVLSYIHSKDVVHRDISPDNLILRTTDNLPVLIDFGGVKQLPASQGLWFTQLPVNRTLLGKKGYAPEEQLRQGKAFHNSDLYSLAVTALVLLAGEEPQKLYDSYQGNWRWGDKIKVSHNFEAVLKKMVAYKPSDRYQNAEQVLKDLQSSILGSNVAASNLPTSAPTYAGAKSVNHLTKINTMVVAPGRKRAGAIATSFHNKTNAFAQTIHLPIWLRPFFVSLVSTSVVVLVFAGTWAVINGVINAVTSFSLPTISLPQLPSVELPSLPGDNTDTGLKRDETNNIGKIIQLRQRLGIPELFFNNTVNQIFYTQNPQARGRTLTNSSEDESLRKKWYGIAQDLLDKLEKANLSKETRQKLGTYSGRDYQTWERRSRSGEFGNYTIEDLNKDTNQKFDRLFPGIRQGNLTQQTFGQIWYALANEEVSKRGN
ncbi:serine/threonine-protein kinase [Rivularia sp. UHCC 0363]|uniref:serine/threonine-protein kinase n=1 Tax=Rivularia sp. UHCC 0363 TaxID=3110244 RepID=UPI002B1FFFBD|nr:serine/threonine-protein kinase [Rivularia sp. UHCC 0363]MEA5593846.1 serine/threonine-protein kinase [Rivularia sp. UHCC 0363]